MIKTYLKSVIPNETWDELSVKKRYIKSLFKPSDYNPELKNHKKLLIIGVADYENLGDHAIGYAQHEFIQNLNLGYPIHEIPTKTPVRHIEQIINPNDILVFTGGGNLGTKYGFLNDIYLPLIKKYPHNKKIFMPQSYTFTSTDSEKLMTKIKKIFANAGKSLTITAREPKSFKLFNETFPKNNIIATPDIVLSLQEINENPNADGILTLMRNDTEKVLSMEDEKALIAELKKHNHVTVPDKSLEKDVSPEQRVDALTTQWDEIKQHKLVITDRLHGMIFAQIMGVPCLVFDNYNHKIKMTCEKWLSDIDSVKFIDPRDGVNIQELVEEAQHLMTVKAEPFDVTSKYEPLINVFNDITK